MKKHHYLKNVTTLKLDTKTCIGCGMCTQVCPQGVFEIQDKKAVMVDRDACMECGACSRNCPVNALSVRPGVGCAYGILLSKLKGSNAACDCSCGESSKTDKSCCE